MGGMSNGELMQHDLGVATYVGNCGNMRRPL